MDAQFLAVMIDHYEGRIADEAVPAGVRDFFRGTLRHYRQLREFHVSRLINPNVYDDRISQSNSRAGSVDPRRARTTPIPGCP